MDDDIAVDFFQLLLKAKEAKLNKQIMGYKQIGLTPQRSTKSKWFVGQQEFPGKEYPIFLSGWAYVTDLPTAKALATAANAAKDFFWIDDVWITGMLAASVDASLVSLNTFYTVYVEHLRCCLDDQPDGDGLLQCDFAVGPSMDDLDLIVKLGKLAVKCHDDQHHCQRRQWQKSVIKTCVKVDNPFFLPSKGGVGEVFVLKNHL